MMNNDKIRGHLKFQKEKYQKYDYSYVAETPFGLYRIVEVYKRYKQDEDWWRVFFESTNLILVRDRCDSLKEAKNAAQTHFNND